MRQIARRTFPSWSLKEPLGSPSAVNVIKWGTKEEQSQAVIEGRVQSAEQAHMGPLRGTVERSGGQSHNPEGGGGGLMMVKGTMRTYTQNRLGLSAYCNKRWVLPDGIHTEPIEYHVQEEE